MIKTVVLNSDENRPRVRLFARNAETGEVEEITNNLYWFEENGVEDLGAVDYYGRRWEIVAQYAGPMVYTLEQEMKDDY